jgi:hypothetical protein
MEQFEDIVVADIKEALGAMTGDSYFAAAGIDEAFIDMFARNMNYFDKLPETTRKKIADQFLGMAFEKSYRTSVGHGMESEDKSVAMADWFKGLNLLLAMAKRGAA